MTITITTLIVWFIISLLVGFLGELLAGRRARGGILGATLVGFIAIFLVVGVFNFSISGEPRLEGVPLISSVLIAAVLVVLWSAVAYPRYYHRRGGYAQRPRTTRRRWF